MLTKRKKSFCIIRGEKIFFGNPEGGEKGRRQAEAACQASEKRFFSEKFQK